nr:ABC transporter substrate-binding protein [Caldilineaceae bacterium]
MSLNEQLQAVSRRRFLKLSALTAGVGLLAACAAPVAPGQTGAAGEGAPAQSGPVNVVVWYQDWDGANKIMNKAKEDWATSHPDVTIELTPIGYSDLFAKLLPAIASGTEGDVLMMYTDWIVGTDVTKVFLDLTDIAGGAGKMEEAMWPAAFTTLDVPGGKIYYLPWLAGIRG